jgi:uncharacterized membrane protein YbaN (DUF454 family)
VGVIIIFIPAIIGLEGFDGGFAVSVGGGFIAMMGLVAAIIYSRLAKSLGRITRKENVLAHWTYTPEEWKQYTEREHREDALSKRSLFILVAVIAVIVGIIFYAIVRENPLLIAMIILGIIAVVGLAAYFSTLAAYLHNKKHLGECFIAPDGIYLNRQIHLWKGLGNKLEEITFDDDKQSSPRIIITYSAPGTHSRNSYTVRIPVPPGQQAAAKNIVKQIATKYRSDSES